MKIFTPILAFLCLVCVLVFDACSDTNAHDDYSFERAVQDLSILRGCSSKSDSSTYCY